MHLTAVHQDILRIADLLPPPVDGHLVLAVDCDASHAPDKTGRPVDPSAYPHTNVKDKEIASRDLEEFEKIMDRYLLG